MFCPRCGQQVPDHATKCANCGAVVSPQTGGASVSLDGLAPNDRPANAGGVGGMSVDPQTRSKRPIVFRGILIALMFVVPWFDVNYYFGSMSVNLFGVGDLLSRASSIGSSLLSLGGGSSSVPAGLSAAGMLSFVIGAVPVVLLGYEIYRYVAKREVASPWGPLAVLAAELMSLLVMVALNTGLNDMLATSFGVSESVELLSVGMGWWGTAIVAGVCLWLERKDALGNGGQGDRGSAKARHPEEPEDIKVLEIPRIDDVQYDVPDSYDEGVRREISRTRALIEQLEGREPELYERLGRKLFTALDDTVLADHASFEFGELSLILQSKEGLAARLERLRAFAQGAEDGPSATIICPACGEDLHAGDKFCGMCGHRVSEMPLPDRWAACPACGSLVRRQAKVCSMCGELLGQ